MNRQVVARFIDAINEHDVDKICSLMTEDHQFIDSLGNEVVGKEKMRLGWIGYLLWFPDYKIEATDFFDRSSTVAAFGFASGTFKGSKDKKQNHWRLPASWKAEIKNGKIQIWQVYADSKTPYDIIKRATRKKPASTAA
jgi:ketosteroid isomerase-like protein